MRGSPKKIKKSRTDLSRVRTEPVQQSCLTPGGRRKGKKQRKSRPGQGAVRERVRHVRGTWMMMQVEWMGCSGKNVKGLES